ncbi:MAG: hypothetical protein KDB00_23785 [Planctomycetales bacterium]|nr:hypothetical protein [Planctomycetales bacterium]
MSIASPDGRNSKEFRNARCIKNRQRDWGVVKNINKYRPVKQNRRVGDVQFQQPSDNIKIDTSRSHLSTDREIADLQIRFSAFRNTRVQRDPERDRYRCGYIKRNAGWFDECQICRRF